jgi:hypothetical protein
MVDVLTSLKEIFNTNKTVIDNISNGIFSLIERISRQPWDVTFCVRLLHLRKEVQFIFIVMFKEENYDEYTIFRESIQEFSYVKMSKIIKQMTSLFLGLKNSTYS